MPKYSFIIPVYNVEKYLEECVNSIISQSFKDFEIILVDDGSTDKSGFLCDEYSNKYDEIRVIHQKNAGLSGARNTGVHASIGSYIIFLDSDDYWSSNSGLKDIDNLISDEVDVLCFASYDSNENTGKMTEDRYYYPDILNHMGSEDCLCYMVSNDLLNLSAAKKVYKKSFFVNNNLYFKPGIKSEDIEEGLRLVCCLPVYRFLNKKLYVYRHRQGSISTSIDKKHLCDYYSIIKQFCIYNYTNDRIKEHILSYIAYQYTLLSGSKTM